MSAEVDRERTAANRDAVIAFLAEELACGIEVRELAQQGIYFDAEARDTGCLQIGENLLADTAEPDALIDRLRSDGVVARLQAGQSITVMSDHTAVVP